MQTKTPVALSMKVGTRHTHAHHHPPTTRPSKPLPLPHVDFRTWQILGLQGQDVAQGSSKTASSELLDKEGALLTVAKH